MRLSAPLISIGAHLLLLPLMLKFASETVRSDAPVMEILPIELMTLSDTTNLTPVAETGPLDAEDKAMEQPKEEFAAAESAPAAAPDDAVAIPDPAAKPEPKTTPTPAPTPTPSASPSTKPVDSKAAEAKPKAPPQRSLNQILADARKRAASSGGAQDQNARTSNEAARKGLGNQKVNTATVADFMFSEMLQRNCWRDASDMPDADRLIIEIKVSFRRGGAFDIEPTLVSPSRPPTGDGPMQTFIQRAFAALNRCEPFQTIPAAYFDNPEPIIVTFAAKTQRRR